MDAPNAASRSAGDRYVKSAERSHVLLARLGFANRAGKSARNQLEVPSLRTRDLLGSLFLVGHDNIDDRGFLFRNVYHSWRMAKVIDDA